MLSAEQGQKTVKAIIPVDPEATLKKSELDYPSISKENESIRNNFYKTMQAIRISELLEWKKQNDKQHGHLICLPFTTSLHETLELLNQEDIQAVPIYRILDEKHKEYLGIVTIWDIISATIFQKIFTDIENADTIDDFQQLVKKKDDFFETSIGHVCGLSQESKESWTMHSHEHLSNLANFLTTARYHRVIVIDDDLASRTPEIPDAAISLITQSDLLNYLYKERYNLSMPKEDIDKLFNGFITVGNVLALQPPIDDPNQREFRKHVVTVPDTFTALSAFKVLYMHHVSSVAIVNPEKKLVANLSATDLRGISKSNLDILCLDSVYKYLEQGVKRSAGSVAADQLKVCEKKDVIGDCMEQMAKFHVHHLWVVDEDEHPVACVSMTDILRMFVDPEKEK